ncbi:hypothetical protein MPLA_770067 [Mesorhizobium sp. ORS 3359]|nr:hypothetical protein MPLA_770067 [Mesorhizobium sp. ORS 3359]
MGKFYLPYSIRQKGSETPSFSL